MGQTDGQTDGRQTVSQTLVPHAMRAVPIIHSVTCSTVRFNPASDNGYYSELEQ